MTDEIDRLATSEDPSALAVYADALQQRGDPRGELIALELAGEPVDGTPWLGEPLARQLVASGGRIARGFVHANLAGGFVDASSFLAALLASPAAPYLRSVAIAGEPRWLLKATTALAAEPRPWLARLAIAQHYGQMPRTPLLDHALVRELIAATPHLVELELAGRRLAGEFVHPRVRTLRVAGVEAIGSLVGGPALPIEELDLAFHHDLEPRGLPDELLRTAHVPALVRLDLSRNEPGTDPPHWLGGRHDVFGFLRTREVLAQLDELRVPSIASDAQHTNLQAALDRAPALTTLAIARSYGFPVRVHGSATITVPPARPWPPFDTVHGRDALTISVPGDPYGEDVNLRGLVRVLENRYDTMSEPARAAWRELWAFLDDLGWEDADGRAIVMHLSYDVLAGAVDSLGDEPDLPRWMDLRTQMRQHPRADTVAIKRYWGW